MSFLQELRTQILVKFLSTWILITFSYKLNNLDNFIAVFVVLLNLFNLIVPSSRFLKDYSAGFNNNPATVTAVTYPIDPNGSMG